VPRHAAVLLVHQEGAVMKPGMQRDILVAYWLLFDEFEIGNDCTPPDTMPPAAVPPRSGGATGKLPSAKKRDAD
jgi:hypothetical protein